MVANQEAWNEESNLLQDPYVEEETLSLSDLPIYYSESISADQYYSKEDGKNDDDDEDEDNLFEFFSQEFKTPSENIVFCGKLIPFKDDQQNVSNSQKNVEISTSSKRTGSKRGGGISNYTSTGKVSLVRSATKSRWFVFMFGMSRLSSNQMQLSDIRNRQSRRREPATIIPALEEKVVKRRSNCKGTWKILRSISLVLGCSSNSKLANDVVKAAFV